MTALYVTHEQTIKTLAASFFSNYADAEDAIQEANIKLSDMNTEGVDNEAGLVYTIVSNLFKDIHKSNKREREGYCASLLEDLIDDNDPLVLLERNDEEIEMGRRVSDLPADLRVVAEMYYFTGLSYRQIATELGLPQGTVASRLNTARKYLTGE